MLCHSGGEVHKVCGWSEVDVGSISLCVGKSQCGRGKDLVNNYKKVIKPFFPSSGHLKEIKSEYEMIIGSLMSQESVTF